jgi:hypothetical protein
MAAFLCGSLTGVSTLSTRRLGGAQSVWSVLAVGVVEFLRARTADVSILGLAGVEIVLCFRADGGLFAVLAVEGRVVLGDVAAGAADELKGLLEGPAFGVGVGLILALPRRAGVLGVMWVVAGDVIGVLTPVLKSVFVDDD